MSAVKFLTAVLFGILAHQTNPVFESLEDNEAVGAGWYRMARYGVGTLAMLPTFILLLPVEIRRKVTEAFLSNAVLFGFGVAVGYVLDKWIRKENEHMEQS